MTDTPRTDAESRHREGLGLESGKVCSDFARTLERDLAQRTAERDALAAEVAALKAHDPLAEMWAALAEYQEQADRDGHGESWAKMCEERTGDWAWEAKLEARKASQDAAWAAADAVARALADATEWAVEVIEAIRRAKEAKP